MSAVEQETIEIGPQPGPQMKFLSTKADIAIYGGGAGGGKSWALMIEPLRNLYTEGFQAVIFRRTRTEITNPGGLWDESQNIYPYLNMNSRESGYLDWSIANGLSVKFSHLQHEKDKYAWKGAQVAFMGFDELTAFTRTQFFYLISRLRSMTGIGGYIRATCNPDAESWVGKFIAWWIDQETGFPIPERDGVLRWFIRQGDDLIWGSSKEELIEEYGEEVGKNALSVTFIRASVFDNKKLLENDPSYLANLNALDRVERARLLDGNWKIKATAGEIFKRSDFKIIPSGEAPICIKRIRYWDRAATAVSPQSPNPDWTVGVDMGITADGRYIIYHVERFRDGVHRRDERMKNIASSDTKARTIGMEHDPGQAGKAEAAYLANQFRGYDIRFFTVSKDKITRARPYAAQAQAGNVYLVEGEWNEPFLLEHENFPPKSSNENEEGAGKDDQVDGSSGAFNFLTGDKVGTMVAPSSQGTTFVSGFTSGNTTEW